MDPQTLPKPYYDHGGITIYHGDCREILPLLEPVDLVLTDPPWIASESRIERRRGGVAPTNSHTVAYGDIGYFDASVIAKCEDVASHDCLFICGFKEMPQVTATATLRGIMAWDKCYAPPSKWYPYPMDLAFIVWGGKSSLLLGGSNWWKSAIFRAPTINAGCMGSPERIRTPTDRMKAAHPAQGPLALYRELLSPDPFREKTILDPYLGTGTTLRAAKDLGRRAIGIEIEERYCEIAAERMRQEVLF